MKKFIFLITVLFTILMSGQNVLTITDTGSGTYIINGTASGDILIATESDANTVRLRNTTLGSSNDYQTISGFTDFLIGGVNPSDVQDAVAKINVITSGSTGGTSVTLDNRIIVKIATDFGVIDSSKEYFLDGIIDMTTNSIEVPAGGIKISGYDFNLSGLTSTENNFTLFTSPVGGSGDVLFDDFLIDISGTNSQVFNIVGDTGFEAIEMSRINFDNCTSLGTIDTYRQGLETGTGRFGGMPELTLAGTWVGGWFIDTSIVRNLTDGSYSLYKAGAGFIMSSRFRSNQNIDLNTNVSLFDFAPSNFVNPSTIQLDGCIISRNGLFDASDITITPNATAGNLMSDWKKNNGIENTFVGGVANITTEVTTVVGGGNVGVFLDLLGTYTVSNLQHFDSPANGQLRHLGDNPREYNMIIDMIIESNANNELDLKVVVWDDSESSFVDSKIVRRVVNSLQGGRNVAYFTFLAQVTLDKNDFVKIQIANVNDPNNIVSEIDSSYTLQER